MRCREIQIGGNSFRTIRYAFRKIVFFFLRKSFNLESRIEISGSEGVYLHEKCRTNPSRHLPGSKNPVKNSKRPILGSRGFRGGSRGFRAYKIGCGAALKGPYSCLIHASQDLHMYMPEARAQSQGPWSLDPGARVYGGCPWSGPGHMRSWVWTIVSGICVFLGGTVGGGMRVFCRIGKLFWGIVGVWRYFRVSRWYGGPEGQGIWGWVGMYWGVFPHPSLSWAARSHYLKWVKRMVCNAQTYFFKLGWHLFPQQPPDTWHLAQTRVCWLWKITKVGKLNDKHRK